ncbi:MAG: hypothetical protein QGI34_20120, partial [Candidatus Latescibacteria bacterium]|nr:hypothetical protein [Candidatus Latescibacterota bacterium]
MVIRETICQNDSITASFFVILSKQEVVLSICMSFCQNNRLKGRFYFFMYSNKDQRMKITTCQRMAKGHKQEALRLLSLFLKED